MRQTRQFVPLRLAIAIFVMVFAAISSPKAATMVIYASDKSKTPIDPIITGQTISADQLEEWKIKKKKFDKCGLCGLEQTYPEDIPN